MAEFKLGRIRFIWKGQWATFTSYVRDDIVQYGGKTYICILAHTASAQLEIDLNNIQPKWEQFGDGVSWEADWQVATYYKTNDIVKNGGYLYVCNEGHTSAATPEEGLELDISKWDLFAEGISYQAIWATSTKYRVNDIIKYGSSTFICITAHTSAATDAEGLEADQASWNLFSQGLDWKGDWDVAIRYKKYDIVRYGGQVYVCNTGHTSAATEAEGLEANQAAWDSFSRGIEYLQDWVTATRYKVNDVVKYGAGLWICTTAHTASAEFPTDTANWASFVPGLEFEDSWSSSTVYNIGDFVTYGGYSYVARTNHTNSIPSGNPIDWAIYLTGFNLIGDWDIVTNYKVGDVVRVGGYTYLAILDSVGYTPPNATYWAKLNEGFQWKDVWADITDYNIGDVVRQGDFSYIAVQTHTSSAGDSPSADAIGAYWNLMVAGTEEYILTTQGDLLYYGGAGPVRLPIGEPGQILKVNSAGDAPEWAYYGLVDNVYYVSVNGTNLPAPDYGVTLDRPWQSVKYACAQILNATQNPNAKYLIDQNIEFIAAETVEWIDYQIANNIAPYTSSFEYDKEICRRDITRLVKHVAYDLSHGGNVESRKAALAYFGSLWAYFVYNQAKCERDVSLLVEAVAYDLTFDSNYRSISSALRYLSGSALVVTNTQRLQTVYALKQSKIYSIAELTDPTAIARATALWDEIIDIVANGVTAADTYVYPTPTGGSNNASDANILAARDQLVANKAFLQDEIIAWIATQVEAGTAPFATTFTYDSIACKRDVGFIVDALIYDLTYGGNLQTYDAAKAYFDASVAQYGPGEKDETVAALVRLRTIVGQVIQEQAVTKSLSNALLQDVSGTPATGTEAAIAQALVQSIETTITSDGATLPTKTAPDITWAGATLQSEFAALTFAKTNIATSTTAWINDKVLNAGNTYVTGQETQTIAAITYAISLVSDAVLANTAPTSNYQTLNGVASPVAQTIDLVYTSETGTDTLFTNLANSTVIASLTAGDTTTLPAEQVVNNTIFIKTGTYAEELPIVLPANTVIVGDELRSTRITPNGASETSDMFYVRNGCGIRNMTLSGLTGSLTSPNAYGTSRPTAGAYVSLDPGEGPEDRLAWTHSRSTYVQNVSTFGTGCIGLKVDGALHNGGNDSIVANDFTQILSDGIGYWVTNLGRSELVSVFTYYNHIGYLAENGGKIRATNGNNSYGAFGSVAEGIDVTEIPITATVNNQYSQAIIDQVYTDGEQILAIGFVAAGVAYTDSTTAITTINGASGVADSNRTQGVYTASGSSSGTGTGQEFEITIGSTGAVELITIKKGGIDHAQSDVITFIAADIGGTGTGFTTTVTAIGDATKYTIIGEGIDAAIASTNIRNGAVTQVQMLNTNSNFGGADYVRANNNAQTGTSTQITIANTDGQATGAYNGMAIFIDAGVGVGQYGYIDTFNAGSKIATVRKVSDGTPGWDHLVPGTAIEAVLDQTSNYTIEPRIIFSEPISGIRAFGRAMVQSGSLFQVNILEPGSGYTLPPTITIVDPNNTVEAPMLAKIGDGVLAQPTWADRGQGYTTATIAIEGDGYADIAQSGKYVFVEGMSDIPQNGANVEFIGTPALAGKIFKLVRTAELTGSTGNYKIRLQVSPDIDVDSEPTHGDSLGLRIRYSQVRLTGHDFLDIGTGNFADTNYPGIPLNLPNPARETVESGGGRVFYTSTDQDGNFRVGELFTVEQATGVASIAADNFSLSGLQELQLGSVGLGGTGAIINEFSTDGTFAANSDSIVPTQRAIRTYLNSQIGGGLSTLNVNTLIAGSIRVESDIITTTTGGQINVTVPVNFEKGVIGTPLALQYFLS
jgi:hypothetical protein